MYKIAVVILICAITAVSLYALFMPGAPAAEALNSRDFDAQPPCVCDYFTQRIYGYCWCGDS
jgi:hypothetical protein